MKFYYQKWVFGIEAKKLAETVGLAESMDGESVNYNTKVTFTNDSKEGHSCILVEFEIP